MVQILKRLLVLMIIIVFFIVPFNVFDLKENMLNDDIFKIENISWKKKVGDADGNQTGGFGVQSNVATGAMEIYKNELFIGTQNFALLNINSFFLKTLVTTLVYNYRLFEPAFLSFLGFKLMNILILLTVALNDGCEVWKYNYKNELGPNNKQLPFSNNASRIWR